MPTTRVTGRGLKGPVDEDFLKQLYQGGEMLAQGRLGEARQWLERAHQLQPRNEKGRNLLGLAYFKLGLFERAAEVYEALVRDNPVDATLRVNLGLVYLKTNALQRAMREFEAATDLQPDHKKAHNYLGLALAQAGEYGRAREHFLLSGSDAMAEKMAKAIAGEGYSRPVRSPAASPVAPGARPAPPSEGQWGAQFGLDEMPTPSVPLTPPEDELRLTDDDDAPPLAPPSPPPAQSEAPPRAEAAQAPSPRPVTGSQGVSESLEGAAPEMPPRALAFPAGGGVPLIDELLPALVLSAAGPSESFRVGHGSLAVHVEGELLTRLEGLVAFSGALQFHPEKKRFRGRATEEAFGEGEAQLVRASGQGVLFLEAAEAHTFLAVHLGDEGAYVREDCVFAFEEAVAFENGKVPSDVSADLDLVHLRGQGGVVLRLAGTLRSLAVVADTPLRVPLSHLVGWRGEVTPLIVPLPGADMPSRTLVELSGEGFALICLAVR